MLLFKMVSYCEGFKFDILCSIVGSGFMIDSNKSNSTVLDVEQLATLLSQGGSLSKLKENYENRSGQQSLLRSICKCFNENIHGAFEAGTGIGKSFAYLIPAITKAKSERERIVISTATINLQNQLLQKDIPFVLKMLEISEEDVKVALVKGRGNYICLRKLEDKINETQFFQQDLAIANIHSEKKDIGILYEWAQKSERGDREDLSEPVGEELWTELSSDAETCLGSLCPHFSKCFVSKMRQKAEEANIIVANHHVLFADIRIKMEEPATTHSENEESKEGEKRRMPSILPSFKYVIFDEAHQLKKTAITFFSQTISKKQIKKYLSVLYVELSRKRRKGIIVELSYTVREVNLKEFEQAQNTLLETYENLESFAFSLLTVDWQVDVADIENKLKAELKERFSKFYQALFALTRYISKTLDAIEDEEEFRDQSHQLSLILKKMTSIINIVVAFLEEEKLEDVVFWFEKKKNKSDEYEIVFFLTPLNVASILKTHLFSKMKSTCSVSATLKVGKSFAYYLNGVGLREEDFEIEKEYFPSPFLYSENVLLSVPQDLPLPTDTAFQSLVNRATLSLIEATDGRALVLFTSYQSLSATSQYVKDNIRSDISIYSQGEKDRFQLLESFKNDIKGCLFATMSFWEGIDVPGEALSNLILVKLPFTVPNHPVTKARAKALEKRGFDSFVCMNIPEAVILFKQGFGRLIRSQRDRGVVTILDKRLTTKAYGKMFLDSIPKTSRCFATFDEVVCDIGKFMKN